MSCVKTVNLGRAERRVSLVGGGHEEGVWAAFVGCCGERAPRSFHLLFYTVCISMLQLQHSFVNRQRSITEITRYCALENLHGEYQEGD